MTVAEWLHNKHKLQGLVTVGADRTGGHDQLQP